jgi:cytochrome c556
MDGKTEAKMAIWEKPEDFKKVLMSFVAEADKLAEVAKGGDKGAIGAQLGALGKNGCKACHDGFREKS